MRVALHSGPVDSFAIRRYTNELADALRSSGVDVEVHRSTRRYGSLVTYLADASRARGHRADLHIICSEGLSYLLLALPSPRTLVVCHDVHPILETRMIPGRESMTLRKRLYRVKYRMSLWVLKLRRQARIVAVSAHTAQHLAEELRIADRRVAVIHNGLSPEWAQPPATATGRDLSMPAGRTVVLHVGNDNWYKNFEGVIEALGLLDRPDLYLVKAGQISDASRRLIEKRGLTDRFRFVPDPSDDELRSLYRQATVLVFPSRHEGFGWPPLEAMAAGCPVVASNTGSLPEICGDAAVYATPSDPRSIANAILALVSDDDRREQLIERGRRRAKQFSWQGSTTAFLELGQCNR